MTSVKAFNYGIYYCGNFGPDRAHRGARGVHIGPLTFLVLLLHRDSLPRGWSLYRGV
jgi:hypothetical protein